MFAIAKKPRAVFALACLVTISGCGKGHSTVAGRVTFDGKPVPDGAISFDPTDGQSPSAGGMIQGGDFRIDRIAPGKKIVRITAQRKTGRKVPLSTIMPAEMCPPGATTDEIEKYIPARYHAQSELTAEITSGSNQVDFDLKPR